MADIHKSFAIRTLPPVGGFGPQNSPWTPVTAPNDCRRLVIRNNDLVNAVALRTDFADATTQDSIPAGLEYTIQISDPAAFFGAGSTVCFFQPVAGTVAVSVKGYR